MFDRLRGKTGPDQTGAVYAFTFKIASGQTQIPSPMVGAYVVAYSTAQTPTAAAERALEGLGTTGYVVEDMDPSGGEIAVARWDEHVAERWPEFVDRFPRQRDLMDTLAREGAVFSPFAGFE